VRHEFGRRHLPYAKMRGHQKLRQSQIFDLENQLPSVFEFTEPRRARDPSTLLVGSVSNIYRNANEEMVLALQLVDGSGHLREVVTVKAVDNQGNPIVNDWIRVEPSGQVQVDPSGAYTNEAGTIRVFVGPTDGASQTGRVDFTHHESNVGGYILTSMDSLTPPS
jgi:hypothetical protein